jgi:biuret amidohydrolase
MTMFIRSIVASLIAVVVSLPLASVLYEQEPKPTVSHYAGPREDAPVSRPGLTPKKGRVAVVVTDLQNDFLTPKGVAWCVVVVTLWFANNLAGRNCTTVIAEYLEVIGIRA